MNFAGGLLLTCFYSFMTALFAALIMVPFLRQWALDKDNVDQPDARKIHDVPMPRLGGIAIFLAFLFSAIIFLPIDESIRGLLAGMLIIFATGVVDDLNGITSRRKFAGQVAACLITILVGKVYLADLGNLFGFGPVVMPVWLGVPFTVFAVVGVINAINLIDGLDGLAGGVSSIALTAFFLIGWLENDPVTMILSAAPGRCDLRFPEVQFLPGTDLHGGYRFDGGRLRPGLHCRRIDPENGIFDQPDGSSAYPGAAVAGHGMGHDAQDCEAHESVCC